MHNFIRAETKLDNSGPLRRKFEAKARESIHNLERRTNRTTPADAAVCLRQSRTIHDAELK